MNKKHTRHWVKHWDFILLDMISLQISFILCYWLVRGSGNPYKELSYQFQAVLLFFCQMIIMVFTDSYTGIMRRNKYQEELAVIKYMAEILVLAIICMFIFHNTAVASRLQLGYTSVFFIVIGFLFRHANKMRILHFSSSDESKRKLVLFTSSKLVDEVEDKLHSDDSFGSFKLCRIVLFDKELPENVGKYKIPVSLLNEETMHEISHEWVDEAFILQPDDMVFSNELMEDLMTMGITVNFTLSAIYDDRWADPDIRKIGSYRVLTSSVKFIPAWLLLIKRITDIIGGIVGCIMTGILFLFVAPAIKLADPGPVFFTQERVGENGKIFKMHKFRSMYMDAESRKADLMEQNKISDGMMFKMEDDPRIIGSEKKDKYGRPKGIGNFIRKTSIDEFPQFFDCLIGNLSLVGWRPCTLEEWEKYDLKHRIRASMKPGITGMWQVSGRSKITDFEEVVKLDREYLENWSILLDLKILLKTVVTVLSGRGAE